MSKYDGRVGRHGHSKFDGGKFGSAAGGSSPPDLTTRLMLSENTAVEGAANGTVVGTVSVFDPLGNQDDGGTFTRTAQSNANWFAIHATTGVITVSSSSPDFETNAGPTITVSYDDGVHTPLTQAFTVNVTNVAAVPVNTVRPAVTGTLNVGDTRTCGTGTWTAVDPVTGDAYQWFYAALSAGEPVLVGGLPVSDGSPASGTTSSTYVLTEDDVDKWLFCRVTATNINGAGLAAYSDADGPATTVVNDPAAIFGANLLWWAEADAQVYSDAGTTLATNTDLVQQVNDRSGNGDNVSAASSGQKPEFLTAGPGGLPTLDFTASSLQQLITAGGNTPGAIDFGTTGTSFFLFFVGKMRTGTSSSGRAISLSAYQQEIGNDTYMVGLARDGSSNAIKAHQGSRTELTGAISLNTTYRIGVVFDGTDGVLYIDNVEVDRQDWSATPLLGIYPLALSIGSDYVNTLGGWDGQISAVVIGKGNPTPLLGDLDDYFTGRGY
jgi:hypothetical protein